MADPPLSWVIARKPVRRYMTEKNAATFLDISVDALAGAQGVPFKRVGKRAAHYSVDSLRKCRAKLPPPRTAEGMARLILDRASHNPNDGGYLYFLQCRELIKMGYSIHPTVRHRQHTGIVPFDVKLLGYFPCAEAAEKDLHVVFRPLRAGHLAEWYHEEPFLRAAQLVLEAKNG